MTMKKKAMINFSMWGGLLSLAIVMALFGLILTVSSNVQQDVRDDQAATSIAYKVGNESLNAQYKLAQKQTTLVTAGIGIFILALLIGGFAVYKMF